MNFTRGLRVTPYTYTTDGARTEGIAIFRGGKLLQFLPTEKEALRLADQLVDTAEQMEKPNA